MLFHLHLHGLYPADAKRNARHHIVNAAVHGKSMLECSCEAIDCANSPAELEDVVVDFFQTVMT